jgi:hypothetical protein
MNLGMLQALVSCILSFQCRVTLNPLTPEHVRSKQLKEHIPRTTTTSPHLSSRLTAGHDSIEAMACPDCFRGGKATGDPKGTISTLHGIETYIAGTSTTQTSQSTIIFYTDAFGSSFRVQVVKSLNNSDFRVPCICLVTLSILLTSV